MYRELEVRGRHAGNDVREFPVNAAGYSIDCHLSAHQILITEITSPGIEAKKVYIHITPTLIQLLYIIPKKTSPKSCAVALIY